MLSRELDLSSAFCGRRNKMCIIILDDWIYMRLFNAISKKKESAMDKRDQLKAIGARLRAARIQVGMTQTATAKSIGMSKQLVSAWEKGRAEILSSHIVALVKVLGCDPGWLLMGGYNRKDKRPFN